MNWGSEGLEVFDHSEVLAEFSLSEIVIKKM